jgi:hypothetical protein
MRIGGAIRAKRPARGHGATIASISLLRRDGRASGMDIAALNFSHQTTSSSGPQDFVER